jgi:Holliday junction resolvase RusA-like endonuclease
MIHTFEFLIKPGCKQSVRLGKGFHYQPEAVMNHAAFLRLSALAQMKEFGISILNCPLTVIINAVYALPKSAKKHDRELVANGGLIPKHTRPDVDNIIKATLDPLNGVVWKDDAQITDLTIIKRYGSSNVILITVIEGIL